MSYHITLDTFPRFIADISQKVSTGKSYIIEIYDENDLYINSPEYNQDRDEQPINAQDFIADLKKQYAYPQT